MTRRKLYDDNAINATATNDLIANAILSSLQTTGTPRCWADRAKTIESRNQNAGLSKVEARKVAVDDFDWRS